ncbi:hypothetical protein [Thioflexithrix psekupsensis]|jgi:hypothetical protein|uniref:Uncharacterized protein n=1 Tax=Thioflexithrix psekupsensis TaxID=1570016 RepID=A0A251X8H2_9GAMM|nr:hypothetical protein [Thioflexithrix psekupsensis]OUD14271.1 hypothetical protein TPSD3_08060 [Thioflexithrix psekupsensis]
MNTQVHLNETLAQQALQYSEQKNLEQLVNQLLFVYIQQHQAKTHFTTNTNTALDTLAGCFESDDPTIAENHDSHLYGKKP